MPGSLMTRSIIAALRIKDLEIGEPIGDNSRIPLGHRYRSGVGTVRFSQLDHRVSSAHRLQERLLQGMDDKKKKNLCKKR